MESLLGLLILLLLLAGLIVGELRLLRAVRPLERPVFSTDVRILGKRLLWSVVSLFSGFALGISFLAVSWHRVRIAFSLAGIDCTLPLWSGYRFAFAIHPSIVEDGRTFLPSQGPLGGPFRSGDHG